MSIVANNFDKLPENVRNELLLKVADNGYGIAKNVVKYSSSRILTSYQRM